MKGKTIKVIKVKVMKGKFNNESTSGRIVRHLNGVESTQQSTRTCFLTLNKPANSSLSEFSVFCLTFVLQMLQFGWKLN